MQSIPVDSLLFLILTPVAAGVSIWLAIYCWQHRKAPGASALAWHMLVISAWLITYVFELLTRTEAATFVWDKLCYFAISIAPVTGYAFALQYTGRSDRATLKQLLPFFIIPVMTILLAQTNDMHHLLWRSYTFVRIGPLLTQRVTSYGPWFWVYVTYAYALTTVSMLLIAVAFIRSFRVYRQQAIWVMIGEFLPLASNLIYIFRLVPGLQQDYSPLIFALGGIFFGIGIFRYRLFDLKPVARNVLVDSMSDVLLVLDEHSRIVDANPAAQLLTGLPVDSLIGQPAASVINFWDVLSGKLAEQREVISEIALTQGGSIHYYDLRITPLHSGRDHLMGTLIILHDITEHRHLIRDLDAYAHSVAHDLKGPLSIIVGYADMLLDMPADSELQTGLSAINQTGHKMVTIVNNLLMLACVRQQEVITDTLDMAFIVAEARDQLSTLAAEAGAKIVMPTQWPEAVGYAPWIETIWVNYLSNALKYGGQPPCIEIGANPPVEGMARFWVRDNGPGLTPEQIAQLFTPFTRLHQVSAAGHGLGLSIVQRIAEKLGGTAGVESQPGQGSLFFFTLPAAVEEGVTN